MKTIDTIIFDLGGVLIDWNPEYVYLDVFDNDRTKMQWFFDNICTNDWNEKTIIGFLSFAVMVLVMIADVLSGFWGNDLPINEFTYNSFVIVTLGSFGIAGLEKFATKKEG